MPEIPEGYHAQVIDSVKEVEGHLVIGYAGKTFGGIVAELLASDEIRQAVVPGQTLIVRYHTAESGYDGQIAHMLIPHPSEEGWAELYADWE